MMPEVIIPSHKRAGKMLTHHILPDAKVCVPESQEDEYRKAYPHMTIITHPDSVVGLLAKRQWILDTFEDVFMVDDDIIGMRNLVKEMGTPRSEMYVKGDMLMAIIERARDTAEQLGAYLYGFTDMANPLMYDGRKPFNLTGYVRGSTMGIRKGSKLWFNTDITTCGGLWVSLLNAYHHRIAFRDARYGAHIKDTGTALGGMSDYRTEAAYIRDREILEEFFGRDAVKEKQPVRTKAGKEVIGIYSKNNITLGRIPW